MSILSLFTSSYTIIQGNMYQIDGSQTTDSFNVITKLVGDSESESSAPESPIGILILCCCLKNLTEIRLLESTPGALFDDVSSPSSSDSPSASKWHIRRCYRCHTYKYSSNKILCPIIRMSGCYTLCQQHAAQ